MEHVGFRYPERQQGVAQRTSPDDQSPANGSASSAASLRASRRWAACFAGSMSRPTAPIWSTGSTAASTTRRRCASAFRFVGQDAELFSGTVRDNLTLGAGHATTTRLIEAVHTRPARDIFLARDASGFDLASASAARRCRAASAASWCWPARWSSPASCSISTSRPARWISRPRSWFIDHWARRSAPDQTLIVSTHRNAMLSIVDRLIVLDQGRIIADGPQGQRDQHAVAASAANGSARRLRPLHRARSGCRWTEPVVRRRHRR